VDSPESLAVRLSDRKTGIGSDGIVLIKPSEKADAAMEMYNADGSQGQVAGNAQRCVAKYLYECCRVQTEEMLIATGAGRKHLKLYLRENTVFSVEVLMGYAEFEPAKVPVKLPGERIVNQEVRLAGEKCRITCLSMGNPHVVQFVPDVAQVKLSQLGPAIEHDPMFPQRVNVSYASLIGRNVLKVRVWERGIGETQACGTGACAVAVAAVENGLCDRGADIAIHLPGGELVIRYDEKGDVWMTGDATKDFEGMIEV